MVNVQNVEQKVNLRLYLGTRAKRSLSAISVTTSLAWTNYDDMNFYPIHKMYKVFIFVSSQIRYTVVTPRLYKTSFVFNSIF
jgi:hypothetical protein